MDKIQNFVIWLDGFIDAAGPELDSSKTKSIKDKLNGLFEHEAEKVEESIIPESTEKPNNYPSYDYFDDNNDGLIRC